jgi:hypothetical protein
MAVTGINSENRLVQATFAEYLEKVLGWDSVYAWNDETFGLGSTLGRADTREAVLTRDLREALERLNLTKSHSRKLTGDVTFALDGGIYGRINGTRRNSGGWEGEMMKSVRRVTVCAVDV